MDEPLGTTPCPPGGRPGDPHLALLDPARPSRGARNRTVRRSLGTTRRFSLRRRRGHSLRRTPGTVRGNRPRRLTSAFDTTGRVRIPDRDPRGRVVSVAYLAIAPGLPEPEAGTDASAASWLPVEEFSAGRTPLAFDHRRILEDGLERARAELEHTSLATAFCGETFTISELQRVYEAVWGQRLDPRNFYRKVQAVPGFILPAVSDRRPTRGRPARLFRRGPRTRLRPPMMRPDPPTSSEAR